MKTRSVLILAAAAAVMAAGTAHAGPANKPLRIADPQGDSTSAAAGEDLLALTLSSGKDRVGTPTLFVRLDAAGPVVQGDTMYEVTFRTPTCAVRLALAARSAAQETVAAPGPVPMTFDCGTGSELFLGFDTRDIETRVAGRSITWELGRTPRVVEPGMQLSSIRAFASVADPTRQVWAANTAGVMSYDTLSSTATYRHG